MSFRRLWLSFQTPADRGILTCARRAFWRHQPHGAWVSLGLSAQLGSSHTHGTRSSRRYQIIPFTRHFAWCEYGAVDVHSAVVKTTQTMAIHSNTAEYHQRRYLSTKREIEVTSMRVRVFIQLQRLGGAERTLVLGLQSQNVAVARAAHVLAARDLEVAFSRARKQPQMSRFSPASGLANALPAPLMAHRAAAGSYSYSLARRPQARQTGWFARARVAVR